MSDPHSGNETSPRGNGPQALPAGTIVGEFEIADIIGEGGFAIVYLAIDRSLGRKVAIKEFMPVSLATREGGRSVIVSSKRKLETFQTGLRSFINEGRILAQFEHPALVKVYRFWEENNTAYMAMPYYKGHTLKQILNEQLHVISEAWLKAILGPVLDALEILHAEQIYHRDISLDNVLIQHNGSPLLLDFGAARRIVSDMTHALTAILKPGYAPIEQYACDPDMTQGPWTDIYALSATVYYLITKNPPANSVTRMMKDSLEPLASTIKEGYSREFLDALDAGLAVRPEARPQSIAAFRRLLGFNTSTVTPGVEKPQTKFHSPPAQRPDEQAPAQAHSDVTASANKDVAEATVLFSATPGSRKETSPFAPESVSSTALPSSPPTKERSQNQFTFNLHKIRSQFSRLLSAWRRPIPSTSALAASPRFPDKPQQATIMMRVINAVVSPVSRIRLPSLRPTNALSGSGNAVVRHSFTYRVPDGLLRLGRWAALLNKRLVKGKESSRPVEKSAMPAYRNAARAAISKITPQTFFELLRKHRAIWVGVGCAVLLTALVLISMDSSPPNRLPDPVNSVASSSEGPLLDPIAALGISPTPDTSSDARAPSGAVASPYDKEPADTTSAIEQTTSSPMAVGSLRFSVKPWGLIMVNGESKGASPPLKALELPEGRHKIDIVNPGFVTYSTNIDVRSARAITISHQFK